MATNNSFLTNKKNSGLSYRQLGEIIGHSREYAHQLISTPGASRKLPDLITLGEAIGMRRSEVVDEWRRLRAEHDASIAERQIGKNGSMKHRVKI